MVWVTWHQHRRPALAAGLLFAVIAAVLLVVGLQLSADYHLGVAGCVGAQGQGAACQALTDAFQEHFSTIVNYIQTALYLVPALVGVFFGAPLLARELEQGTHRLAWTQSISRLRWITVKLALVVAVTLLVSIALAALVGWWRAPLDQLHGSSFQAFDIEGPALVAYTMFALALGIAIGTFVRSTIPAMALTLFAFAGIRVAVEQLLRPHFLPALISRSDPSLPTNVGPAKGSWLFSYQLVEPSGHILSQSDLNRVGETIRTSGGSESMSSYFHTHGILATVLYQPADRYWLFQGIEAAIFFTVAVALLALTVWLVRQRAS